jgi:hypothetical protein
MRSEGADKLEEEAIRLAVHGVDGPVSCQGRIVGYTKEYSDYLLIKLLEANARRSIGHAMRG